MKKRMNVGKSLSILAIVLAFVVVIMGLLLLNQWLSNRNSSSKTQIALTEQLPTVNASDVYYDNNWAKSIVTQIVDEDVPIPVGLEYIQGNKETGVIVKDSANGNLMLWIPYDDTVTEEGMEEYYQNCQYIPMDVDTKESIALYGGFYVTLEKNSQYDVLKQVKDENYQQVYQQAQKAYQKSESLSSHLLYKTELAQISAYSQKLGMQLTQTKQDPAQQMRIQKMATSGTIGSVDLSQFKSSIQIVTIDTYDKKMAGKNETFIFKSSADEYFIIPAGFNFRVESVTKGSTNATICKIQDKNNKELRYIWVPVPKNELEKAKEKLESYYTELDAVYEFRDAKDTKGKEYEDLLYSIEAFGGFYIAEAELGYYEDGTITNRARGMVTEEETGWAKVNVGEYYRGIDIKNYSKAMEMASKVHEDNTAVVSHLMYGAEWDATMLWLLDTNKDTLTKEKLILDSSEVTGAKYSNVNWLDQNGKLEDKELKTLNGIYGLAGNLIELTQETMQENETSYRILRGGSYLYPGNSTPIASRIKLTEDWIEKGQDIGFRNCLFLNKESIMAQAQKKYFNISDSGEISVLPIYTKGGDKEDLLPEELMVPSELDGITVTSIGEMGFLGCEDVTKITLPRTLKKISDSSFADCKSLKEIVIPSSVTQIEEYAFENCTNLSKVTFVLGKEKTISIEKRAFYKCSNLEEFRIDYTSELTQNDHSAFDIDSKAFEKCSKLTTLTVPSDLLQSTIDYIKQKISTIKTVNKVDIYYKNETTGEVETTESSYIEEQVNLINSYATNDPNYVPVLLSAEEQENYKNRQATEKANAIEKVRKATSKEEAEKIRLEYELLADKLISEWKAYEYQTSDPEYRPTLSEADKVMYEENQKDLKDQAITDIQNAKSYDEAEQIRLQYEFNAEKLILKWKLLDYVPSDGWEDYQDKIYAKKDYWIGKIDGATKIEDAEAYELRAEEEIEQIIENGG